MRQRTSYPFIAFQAISGPLDNGQPLNEIEIIAMVAQPELMVIENEKLGTTGLIPRDQESQKMWDLHGQLMECAYDEHDHIN